MKSLKSCTIRMTAPTATMLVSKENRDEMVKQKLIVFPIGRSFDGDAFEDRKEMHSELDKIETLQGWSDFWRGPIRVLLIYLLTFSTSPDHSREPVLFSEQRKSYK